MLKSMSYVLRFYKADECVTDGCLKLFYADRVVLYSYFKIKS
jgi:hypothetical protein